MRTTSPPPWSCCGGMSGAGSTDTAYNPDIFSVRRIKVAPVVCLVGFVMMIYAVVHKPKATDTDTDTDKE